MSLYSLNCHEIMPWNNGVFRCHHPQILIMKIMTESAISSFLHFFETDFLTTCICSFLRFLFCFVLFSWYFYSVWYYVTLNEIWGRIFSQVISNDFNLGAIQHCLIQISTLVSWRNSMSKAVCFSQFERLKLFFLCWRNQVVFPRGTATTSS